MAITNLQVNWFLMSSSLATSPISFYFSGSHLILIVFFYIVHDDDDEEEINLLTYLLTYVKQLFVTCYVHTINSTTICVIPVDATVSAVQ